MAKKTIQHLFGERVRVLRQKQGLSQEELAYRAGIHRTYLGGIERGERNPALKNIAAMAEALEVSLFDLFHFEERGNKPK
ncbi:helix-turn-helix domain-containing protein [Chloroflexota bacterium]